MSRELILGWGRVMMLPLTGMTMSAERLTAAIRELERLAENGLYHATGHELPPAPVASPAVAAPPEPGKQDYVSPLLPELHPVAATPAPPPVVIPAPPVPQPAPASASRGEQGTEDSAPSRKDRYMDKDLRDDMLKLVKYRLVFVKREYEAVLDEGTEVIEDNMDGSALTAWKVAEYMEQLPQGKKMPSKWPDPYPENHRDTPAAGQFNGLPEDDRKYLRLSYEVVDRYPRERLKYEETQLKILEKIANK